MHIIREATPEEVFSVGSMIPEFSEPNSLEKISQRLNDTWSLCLVATVDSRLVGYKCGYALQKDLFYSWIGGVLPGFRRQGIAQALLREQERRVSERQYSRILVKTDNRFPNMQIMLLKHGYLISGVELNGKIHYTKAL